MADKNLQNIILGATPRANGDGSIDLSHFVQSLSGGASISDALKETSQGLSGLTSVNQLLADSVGTNTEAVLQNSVAHSSSGLQTAASTIGKVASGIFGSGLGLAPVVSAVRHLFGGGDAPEPPPLVRYIAPAPLRFDGANPTSLDLGIPAVDNGQNGQPRIVQPAAAAAAVTRADSPITIHVQAMDSRSFMDHSQEIANAVRQAMLNMHSINDVVSDL
jgi:hypothetical protein